MKALEVGVQPEMTAQVDYSSLLLHRSLADLIGSGVVYALQDILDHYIPLVGNENRDALVKLVRQEANEYLDQELIQSPFPQLSSKSCDRPLSTRVTTELLSVDLHLRERRGRLFEGSDFARPMTDRVIRPAAGQITRAKTAISLAISFHFHH